MINLGYDFERRIENMVTNRINANSIKPLTLGGVAGPSGGIGSPIGGLVGQLSQIYITYDTTEAAIDTPSPLPSGVSLVTNLNKIRYDISQLDSKVTVLEGFSSGLSFTDITDVPSSYTNQGGKVLIVSSGEDSIEFRRAEHSFAWFIEGELASGVHPLEMESIFDYNVLITKIKGRVKTSPTGCGITIDVRLNGTTILPSSYYIPAGGNGSLWRVDDGFETFSLGDVLVIDIEEVGTSFAGSDLLFQIGGVVL